QAEDGIRDPLVTGVQTCALPIWTADVQEERDVVEQDEEEEAEEEGETAHRKVRDRVEIQEARCARRHASSDEAAGTSIRRRQNQERATDVLIASREGSGFQERLRSAVSSAVRG